MIPSSGALDESTIEIGHVADRKKSLYGRRYHGTVLTWNFQKPDRIIDVLNHQTPLVRSE